MAKRAEPPAVTTLNIRRILVGTRRLLKTGAANEEVPLGIYLGTLARLRVILEREARKAGGPGALARAWLTEAGFRSDPDSP